MIERGGALDGGVRGGRGETALTSPLAVDVANDHDVAVEAPRRAPRVLDEPKVLVGRLVVAIAGQQDTVVQVDTARGIVEHTARVELEDRLVGLDGDGNRLLGVGNLQLVLVVDGDIGEGRDGGSGRATRRGASAVGASVGVGGLSANATIGDDVLEGLVHQTTVAALVALSGRAVHQLLLRQGDQLALGDLPSTLDGTRGGEGPASGGRGKEGTRGGKEESRHFDR